HHQRATTDLAGDVELLAGARVQVGDFHTVERVALYARTASARPASFGQSFGRQFAEFDGEGLLFAVADDFDGDLGSGRRLCGHEAQMRIVVNFLAVEFNDDVAFLQSGFCGGRFRSDFADERPGVCR